MSKIRVLRVLEYIYDDADMMMSDMTNWQVGANGIHKPNLRTTIRSSMMLPEAVEEDE